jgi:hypothetical protein
LPAGMWTRRFPRFPRDRARPSLRRGNAGRIPSGPRPPPSSCHRKRWRGSTWCPDRSLEHSRPPTFSRSTCQKPASRMSGGDRLRKDDASPGEQGFRSRCSGYPRITRDREQQNEESRADPGFPSSCNGSQPIAASSASRVPHRRWSRPAASRSPAWPSDRSPCRAIRTGPSAR